MGTRKIQAGGVYINLQFAIVDDGAVDSYRDKRCVLLSGYERSKESCTGFWANMHNCSVSLDNANLFSKDPYKSDLCQVVMGKESAYHLYAWHPAIGETSFICKKGRLYADFYSYLMSKFPLPLLEQWIEPLLEQMKDDHLIKVGHSIIGISSEEEQLIKLNLKENGGMCSLSDIECVRIADGLTSEEIVNSLKKLYKMGKIRLANVKQKPFKVNQLDTYLEKYGSTVVENMKHVVKPLIPLKGTTDNVALKRLRLYPQQLAIVNGAQAALKRHPFVFMNEDMGTGKTIQSLAVVDGVENQKWMDRHPGTDLKDVFADRTNVKYRAIIMCPVHLVEKWAAQIHNDIPYAKVYQLTSFEDVLAIKERGRKATCKEFYVVGKDFAKLSYMTKPVPTKFAVRPVGKIVCADCGEKKEIRGASRCHCGGMHWVMEHRQICSKCGRVRSSEEGACECGGNWLTKPMSLNPIRKKGMICPNCDNLIWPYQNKYDPEGEEFFPLSPEDFSTQTMRNSKCYVCGENLWEPRVSNIGNVKKSKWHVVKQYSNAKRKSTSTAWVLRGREREYESYSGKEIICDVPDNKGRRYSPATYIKKHLNGYFDYAIFDEAHLYKGGATAQGNAMASLVSASKKQLLLTGTLLNGYANAIFYLMFRVAPQLMKNKGFDWDSELDFAKKYGVVQTRYEFSETGAYNKTSRGKQLSQPSVKPGISPMVIVDFLLPYQLTLNLTDMSKFLPPLKEQVVTVEPDKEVLFSYNSVIQDLNAAAYTVSGARSGSDKLQFALSYPDKPYGRSPIISTVDGTELSTPTDLSFLVQDGAMIEKERVLVEKVRSELSEGRNSVIFVEYTNSAETIITQRLKYILENNISELVGRVCVIESAHPKAREREAWMHERAREGVQCFIVNPRCVETGLDFVWSETDQFGITTKYNFPTLHFFQCGYNLFTLWQASRRHYRLCQTEECRTYYYAYKDTIQMDVLQILAEKQTATAAIQGKFSAEGLSKMAQQVDSRVRLAQSLSGRAENVDEDALVNMFDAINVSNNEVSEHEQEIMAGYKPMPLFSEVIGTLVVEEDVAEEVDKELLADYTSDSSENFTKFLQIGMDSGWFKQAEEYHFEEEEVKEIESKSKNQVSGQESLFSLMFS